MSDKEIIPPSKTCACCENAVAVLQVEVEDVQTGKVVRGPFSQFQAHGTTKRILRNRYRFKRWWERCSNCFYTDTNEQEEMFA